jgi:hypothetical protein
VQDACKVLEHPKCNEKDNVGSALFGGPHQNGEGRKEVLLTALECEWAILFAPGPTPQPRVAQPFDLVAVGQFLFPLGHHFVEQKTVSDAPQGSSLQDEQQMQRIGQAKFDLIVSDLSDGCPDEVVETKSQGWRVPFGKEVSVQHTCESAPVQAVVNHALWAWDSVQKNGQ